MSTQTDWIGEPNRPPRERAYGAATTQGRIQMFAMLTEAGPQGCETDALVAAGVAVGLAWRSVKGILRRAIRDGLIFGKGAYLGHGLSFRYFAQADWCAAYEFEGRQTPDDRRERRERLARERWARLSAEEQQAQRERRNERIRVNNWKKKGVEDPPSVKEISPPAESEAVRMERKRQVQREWYRARREAAGYPVGTRAPNGQGRKAKKKAAELAAALAARPGVQQVVVLKGTRPAPVKTTRPVLVGEPVITSATRVTVAPVRPDYRYHVEPSEVRSVFGAMRVGEYLEEVCDAV